MFLSSHRWLHFLLFLLVCLTVSAQIRQESAISIKIRPVKAAVLSGVSLDVRVEIANQSDQDLLFSRPFWTKSSMPIGVSFEITDSTGAPLPQQIGVGDCFMKPDSESLPMAVLRRWINIPAKSNLAFTVKLEPSEFPAKPGRYNLVARYKSIGLTEESWTNCVKVTQGEVAKLPIGAFAGEIESNSVTVTVLAHKSHNK